MPPKNAAAAAGAGGKQPRSGGGKKSSSAGNNNAGGATEGAEEEPLAAVVLADSFDARFSPLTLSRPRCLLPFCGVPLLDLTLQRLLQAGVAKVYVLSRAHTPLVRAHVDALRKSGAVHGMDIVVYALPEAASVGHAMQDLDTKQVIRGDFVLVHPDAVGNVDIREMVRVHKERKKRDRDAIMTIGMTPLGGAAGAAAAPPTSVPVVALRPSTHQLLHWHTPSVDPSAPTRRTTLPFEDLFADSDPDPATSEVELRMDLRETGIDICGVEVPPLFSENFDYQKLRSDFVVGILTSDLLDSRLYLHVAEAATGSSPSSSSSSSSAAASGYGTRCDSTRAYDDAAMDVLHRCTFPLSPGSPAWPGERLEARQAARYVGAGVVVDRSAQLGRSTLLSSGCVLSPRCTVSRSTLGAGVHVGEEAHVLGAHIFPGTKVGRGCSVTSSILGFNVTLLDGVIVPRGCLIGDNVVLGPNVALQPGTRVATRRQSDVEDSDDEDEDEHSAHAFPPKGADPRLGTESIGFTWAALGADISGGGDKTVAGDSDSDSDSDEDEDPMESPATLRHLLIGAQDDEGRFGDEEEEEDDLSSIDGDSEFGGYDDSDSESGSSVGGGGDPADAAAAATAKLSSLNLSSETHYEAAAANERLREFRAEARASLSRAFDEGHTIDNASIELKTLRMASNVPLEQVRAVVVRSLLARCSASDGRATAQWLDRWLGLLPAISGGSSEELPAGEGREVIDTMQTYCAVHADTHGALFVPLLKKLYNEDVLTDEAFVSWWKSPTSRDGAFGLDDLDAEDTAGKKLGGGERAEVEARRVELRRKAEAVVRWVVEQGESSEEEDSEEEEDDE